MRPRLGAEKVIRLKEVFGDDLTLAAAYGDTSGDRQWLREARYDCDGDVILLVVEQEGRGACHTGEHSCFFRAFGSGAEPGPR